MRDINSRIKGGKMHLKSFPGTKASQLNHYIKPTLEVCKYNCAIIHVGINDIIRNKNDTYLNNLADNLAKITTLIKYSSRLYYHQSEPKSISHKSMKP